MLIAAKLAATLFAVFVYSNFTSLGDADRYLAAEFHLDLSFLSNRTLFTDNVFAALKLLLVQDILVHLAASAAVGCTIWWVFRRNYAYSNKKTLWACLLMPHFLIWTGVVAKEPIAVIGFLLVTKACVDITVYGRANIKSVVFGVAISVLMRPHYAIAYCFLLAVTILLSKSRLIFTGRSGMGYWSLVFAACCACCSLVLWSTYEWWAEDFYALMEVGRDYFFLYDGRSNRYYIEWSSTSDYFRDLWWGIPVSIIGPTLSESMERIQLMPAFLEGLVSLFLIVYLLVSLVVYSARNKHFRPLVCIGFLPALTIALLAHSLLGVYNPGSALRYKQSLAPLFYFYPLLLLAEARRKSIVDYLSTRQRQKQVSKSCAV